MPILSVPSAAVILDGLSFFRPTGHPFRFARSATSGGDVLLQGIAAL
jgi:hypothetical protein